jgi:PAS domain S-box-containing protein
MHDGQESDPDLQSAPGSTRTWQGDSFHLGRQALESSLTGIAISGPDGVLTFVNRSFLRMWGYESPDEVLGRSAVSFWVSPEEAEQVIRELGQSGAWVGEMDARKKDGERATMHLSAAVLVEPDGTPVGLVGSFVDISYIKRTEARLRHLGRLHALLSQINQAIVRIRDRDELYPILCDVAIRFGEFRMAWIGLIDPDTGITTAAAHAGHEEGYVEWVTGPLDHVSLGHGPTGTALREGGVRVCHDIATDPAMAPWREAALERGYASSASVPFRSRGRVAGTLNLYAGESRFFTDDDVRLLEEIGVDISFALDTLATEADRVEAESALRESEERLRLALSAANQGLYDLDLVTGEATVNPEYARMLGYDPAAFHESNEAWMERLHPDDRERVEREYRSYVAGEIAEYRVEFRQRTGAGDWKWILSLGRIVAWSDSGEPLRMLGTHTDVTEAKQAEAALRERDELLRQAVEVAKIGIFQHDHVRDAIYWSPRQREIHGWGPDEPVTLADFVEMIHPEDRERISDAVVRAHDPQGDGIWDVEHRITRRDGTVRWLTAKSLTSFEGEGAERHPVRTVGAVRDVTAEKQADEDRTHLQAQVLHAQKMESVGRLAGGVAHDFNNMLGVILGYADLLGARVEPGNPMKREVDEIRNAAQRSANLTGQLLAFARKQAVSPRVLDLNDTVSHMLTMLRRLIGEHVDLVWAPGKGVWPVRMDPAQVDQILANLCVNARDAVTDTGRIDIRTENVSLDEAYCSQYAGFAPGDYVLLTVRDNGEGMDEEVLAHLFEPFYTTKGLGRGTGLGLATVYGIVKQNHGFIRAESKQGVGTVFSIYLPNCAHEKPAAPEPDPPEAPRGGSQTVLLVEDEPMLLNMARTMLRKMGYRVLSAATPTEALRLADQHSGEIHVLLTDVVLPEMNGVELVSRIRGLHPALRTILMSGYAEGVIPDAELLDEETLFLQKPFTMRVLGESVRKALD